MDSLNCDVFDSELIRLCEEIEHDQELYELGEFISQLHRQVSHQVGRGMKRSATSPCTEVPEKKICPSNSRGVSTLSNEEPCSDVDCVVAALFAVVTAAPPSPPRFYQGGQLDYYLDNAEVANYYSQAQQKQGQVNPNAPARLENLEPDSEVELVPGVQQPQQPPQQNPVSPNLPGLVPGQRVFIVHMPVPGYRPGTIGGYQPLYIVAAGPQGNPGAGYAVNGYQNAILLDPSGQGVQLSPVNGYYRPGLAPQQNPGLLLGAPLGLQRPFDFGFQDPNLAYQQVGPQPEGQPLRLAPVPLRQQSQAANPAPNANQSAAPSDQKRVGQSSESNELKEEPRRNRPVSAHAPRKP